MTASLGVGGGSFLIMVMASIMPPMALIPVHGMVQLGSNSSRAALTRQYTQWHKVAVFLVGAIIAAALTIVFLTQVDTRLIPLIVALFILWHCWGRLPKLGLGDTKLGLLAGGLVTTVASMLVGASGPLVSAWLGGGSADRWQYTANFSTCMTLQHSLKLVVFGIAGFVFLDWLVLILLMVATGFVGTKIGLKLLGKLPEKQFKLLFKWTLTVLALRIIWLWWGGG